MPSSTSARTLLCGLLLLGSNSLAEGPTGDTPEVPRPAAPPPTDIPSRRLNLDHFVGGGVNPTVAEYRTRISYKQRLGQSEDLLWRDTFLSLGGQVRLNPCYTAVGPMVQWQPIAVFNLKALVDAYGFFGTAGMLQSFRSPLDEHSDAVQRARTEAQDTYSTTRLARHAAADLAGPGRADRHPERRHPRLLQHAPARRRHPLVRRRPGHPAPRPRLDAHGGGQPRLPRRPADAGRHLPLPPASSTARRTSSPARTWPP